MRIDPKFVAAVRSAKSASDLAVQLQNAIQLEHSTIPPYLTALFSLKPSNQKIANLIYSIVIEEMLHMTIACNILIAIGGQPTINVKGFIPQYPGPLPMNIGDLRVGIESFSIPLVQDVFMTIEEPEYPVPVTAERPAEEEEFATIGNFYDAVKERINSLGAKIFINNQAMQALATGFFDPDSLFPITGPADANRAIDIIKTQGEGTSTDPFDNPGNPAHFYKFQEIARGRTLATTQTGFSDDGDPIPFDPSGVWPLRPNCRIADYPNDSQAKTAIKEFATGYSSILNTLHDTFNGSPDQLGRAVGLMPGLQKSAESLIQTPDPTAQGFNVGPSFEYI